MFDLRIRLLSWKAKIKKLEKTGIITIIQIVKVEIILLSEMSIADTCSLTYI